MVQFFQGSRDPRDEAVGKLSEALGMGIHDKLYTFLANRSLESVQKDKTLQDAPISKKMEAAYKAVSPYGEIGQKLFQQKMQTYQQEQKENEEKMLLEAFSKMNQNGNSIDPESQALLAMKYPQVVSAYQTAQKAQAPQQERERKAESGLATAEQMKGLLKYTGRQDVPFTSSFGGDLNRTAVQNREKFDFLAAEMASFLRDLDTKGQLPQGLYDEVIKTRLPSSKLSERQNLGRIEAYEDLVKRYGGEKFSEKHKAPSSNKTKFTFSNPNHKAKFDKLVSQFGMNEQKIREVLEKDFELD